jgi:hypothetical protein
MFVTLILSALAATPTCPSTAITAPETSWDTERAWMHPRGWFPPLDNPEVVPVRSESYPDDEPMLVVVTPEEVRAYPVAAMATHHVANDVVGGVPLTVTY